MCTPMSDIVDKPGDPELQIRFWVVGDPTKTLRTMESLTAYLKEVSAYIHYSHRLLCKSVHGIGFVYCKHPTMTNLRKFDDAINAKILTYLRNNQAAAAQLEDWDNESYLIETGRRNVRFMIDLGKGVQETSVEILEWKCARGTANAVLELVAAIELDDRFFGGFLPHPRRRGGVSDEETDATIGIAKLQLQYLATHQHITVSGIAHSLMQETVGTDAGAKTLFQHFAECTFKDTEEFLFTDISPGDPATGMWILHTTNELFQDATTAVSFLMSSIKDWDKYQAQIVNDPNATPLTSHAGNARASSALMKRSAALQAQFNRTPINLHTQSAMTTRKRKARGPAHPLFDTSDFPDLHSNTDNAASTATAPPTRTTTQYASYASHASHVPPTPQNRRISPVAETPKLSNTNTQQQSQNSVATQHNQTSAARIADLLRDAVDNNSVDSDSKLVDQDTQSVVSSIAQSIALSVADSLREIDDRNEERYRTLRHEQNQAIQAQETRLARITEEASLEKERQAHRLAALEEERQLQRAQDAQRLSDFQDLMTQQMAQQLQAQTQLVQQLSTMNIAPPLAIPHPPPISRRFSMTPSVLESETNEDMHTEQIAGDENNGATTSDDMIEDTHPEDSQGPSGPCL